MESGSSSEEHGGLDPAELAQLGILPDNLVDFSVNSNPFGPSPRLIVELLKVDISRYPDRKCRDLCERLASLNGVRAEQILTGNGTSELIWLAVQALIEPGDGVLIVGPTFGEYRRAAEQVGAVIHEIRAAPPDFDVPVGEVLDHIRHNRPRLVFLCNPNNPTGKYLSEAVIRTIESACPPEAILVLDEAYRSFVDGNFFGGKHPDNCLVLRSMTKDFALAGVRLGYAIGSGSLIARLNRCQPAWSVNSIAQAAGLVALAGLEYYRQTLKQLREISQDFYAGLRTNGLAVVPSDVHFTLIPLPGPARSIRMELLKYGLQVRDCTSFGLPEYIRVSTRLEKDNQKLIDRLREVCLPGLGRDRIIE